MEVATSRYYLRRLTNFRTLSINGHCFATAEYEEDHRRLHVFMAYAEYPQLDAIMRALCPFLVKVPADEDIVLDFFTWKQDDSLPEAERTQSEIKSAINLAEFPRPIGVSSWPFRAPLAIPVWARCSISPTNLPKTATKR